MYYKEAALLIVRLTLGITFLMHGSEKVKKLFSGQLSREEYLNSMQSLGVPSFLAILVAAHEFFGGILLTLGFAAQIGALLIIPVMIGAIILVTGKNGFFSYKGGYEYNLNLIMLAIVVIIGGPGLFALWNPFFFWR